ncbi:MAG: diguanylate cyclase, partial [Spirochaetota bacterium]
MMNKEEGKQTTVMIVDDDPFVRAMIADIITQGGFTVLEAEDAANGLSILKQQSPNVVITDLNMPGLNGLEFIERIREKDSEIPIIVLTVNSEVETAIEAVQRGADDYIFKGAAVSETLPIALAKVLELYELKQQNRELILDLSKKNAELEHLAFLDGLTGVYNRRFYETTLESEWESAKKNQQRLALIMTDIDSFKQLNDTLGHQYGDLCIQKTAKALSRLVRHTDGILARFGGDEFIIFLRNTEAHQVQQTAEAMR